jgi:ATP-dependent helicase/nuclease subunit B
MRRLLTSFSAGARLRAAADFLCEFAGRELLLVAPTRMAADELIRETARSSGSSFGVHRFTPASLAVEIAGGRLVLDGYSILSGVAVEALAARATSLARSSPGLGWFEPVASTPGFFRALASTLLELRMNDVDRGLLAAAGPAGADLSLLLHEFQNALMESRVADLALIYRSAAREACRYRTMPMLLVDIAPQSVLERRFINSLIEGAADVTAVGHRRSAQPFADPPVAEAIDHAVETALSRLRRQIFSTSSVSAGEMDDSIHFRSASDENRETVEIARSAMASAARGIPFDRMAVLLRNPDMYQPLIEDAMRRAGIPAFYTQGSRRPNPTGRAFLALLACAADGLSASRFAEYLSLAQVPDPETPVFSSWVPVQGELFPDLREAPEIAPATPGPAAADAVRAPYAWERLLVDSAVIGGLERWERRLSGLDHEFEKQLREVSGDDEARMQRLHRQRARLKDLREFALPLIRLLAGLPASATWGEWLEHLEQLARKALRQPQAVLMALAELRPMAQLGSVGLDEVQEVLSHRLTFLRSEPTDRRYGKILVSTISEAAGMTFDVVFVPGLGEDIFPRRAFEDPLFLDDARKGVSEALKTQDVRVQQERLLLHIAAGAAERRLFVSYPRMNLAQARGRGPSFYALEVVRAATGNVPDLLQLQHFAAEASEAQAGWPSPRQPASAIDDAEYDLALVSRLLRVSSDEAKGRARYLVSANESLARSLRTRSKRWWKKWTEVDGVVSDDAGVLAALAKHRIAARPYSATALQHFAACPFRFLLYSIHKLQPRDEIVALERMDALTRGSLFHAIQFRLLGELRARALLPVTAGNFQHVVEVADTVINAVAADYREELAPAVARIWEGEVEDIRWDLRGWLREMVQPDGVAQWTPRWFELSFGLDMRHERDPESASEAVHLKNGLILRGAIDMIEEREGRLRITDHKTGRAPLAPPGPTGRGEVLQPVLYAQAAEAVLVRPAESARLFYCTERGGYRSVDVPFNDESRSALDRVIQSIDESLAQGFLPAAPREGACKWCDYKIVCGPYEETRVRRKPKDRLASLEQIRK